MLKFCLLTMLYLMTTQLEAYTYQRVLENKHVIHVVEIDPKTYEPLIIKAGDAKIGRKTVPELAKAHGAEIGINAGFFEIGDNKDGLPSGSLISRGKAFGIKNFVQPLFIINNKTLSIRADNANTLLKKHSQISLVSGIPLLISQGKINQEIFKKKGAFYTKPHARTAIGLTREGSVVIVVVEHIYKKDFSTLTLGEVQSLLHTKNMKDDLSLTELKAFLKKEFQAGVMGLTALELAEFMKKKGCVSALNLDGGGSSTLFIKDKVVNQTLGDIDEAEGLKVVRPVSDAILFRKSSE